MALNKVIINGRLTADPEKKQTQSGISVTSFSIAVNKNKEETDFFRVTAWRSTADFICQYFRKGDGICIDGHLATTSYEKDGKTYKNVEIVCDAANFPVGGTKAEGASKNAETNFASPVASTGFTEHPAHAVGKFEQISDDSDLPF